MATTNTPVDNAHNDVLLALDAQPLDPADVREKVDVLHSVAQEQIETARRATPDGKDRNGYPIGWPGSAPDAIPGAQPPAPGMMPGSPLPEMASTTARRTPKDKPAETTAGQPETDAEKTEGAEVKTGDPAEAAS